MKHSIVTLLVAGTLFFTSCDKAGSGNSSADSFGNSATMPGTGKGGSLARFTIATNHLYVVDNRKLYTYSLATGNDPQLRSTKDIGSDVETIYSFKDKLFIGSMNAMYVYSISDAANPTRLGTASHVRACDPVVANDTIAYVTVRTGSTCGGNTNALFVYDVRQVLQPIERNTVPLESPQGLGMNGNRLYVCNGSNGLNVYDISNPIQPKLVKKFNDDAYYDVIPTDNLLICMVQGGTVLYQYESAQELGEGSQDQQLSHFNKKSKAWIIIQAFLFDRIFKERKISYFCASGVEPDFHIGSSRHKVGSDFIFLTFFEILICRATIL